MRLSPPLLLLALVAPLTLIAAANAHSFALLGAALCAALAIWHVRDRRQASGRDLIERQSSEVEKLREMMANSSADKTRTK